MADLTPPPSQTPSIAPEESSTSAQALSATPIAISLPEQLFPPSSRSSSPGIPNSPILKTEFQMSSNSMANKDIKLSSGDDTNTSTSAECLPGQNQRPEIFTTLDEVAIMIGGAVETEVKFKTETEVKLEEDVQHLAGHLHSQTGSQPDGPPPAKRAKTTHPNDVEDMPASIVLTSTSSHPNLETAGTVSKPRKRPQKHTAPKKLPNFKKGFFSRLIRELSKTSEGRKSTGDALALENAVMAIGVHKMKTPGTDGLLWNITPKLTTSLYHYQLTGVHWMLEREKSAEGPKGGILGDEQGLGKTLQSLALVHLNRAPADTPKDQRCMLIVVTQGLTTNWLNEFEAHAEKLFNQPYVYEGSSNQSLKWHKAQAITIASYDSVRQSYFGTLKSQKENAKHSEDNEEDYSSETDVEPQRKPGILHQINWRRIIIDEAHAIKNSRSKKSQAVLALKGVYKWALSATPVMNSYAEFQPVLRFIGVPHACNMKTFNLHYNSKVDPEGSHQSLMRILSAVMKARRKEDSFMGNPILKLPQLHRRDVVVEFDPIEQLIYSMLDEAFKDTNNGTLAGEEPQTQRRLVAFKFNIQRQMTANILIAERQLLRCPNIAPFERLRDQLATGKGSLEKKWFRRLTSWIEQMASSEVFTQPPTCMSCVDGIDLHEVPGCGDIICKSCMDSSEETADSKGEDLPQCYICGIEYDPSRATKHKTPDSAKQCIASKKMPKKNSSKKKAFRKGKDLNNIVPASQNFSFMEEYDNGAITIGDLQSSKIAMVQKLVQQKIKEFPDDKIIIFTHWITVANILGVIFERLGPGFVYYTGEMDSTSRTDAIATFKTDPKCKIMIATPQTAAVGLNLQFANHVILVDLWYNSSIEEQALGRVHRIGQKKDTYFDRIVMDNSVDERIITLQEKKKRLLESDHPGEIIAEDIEVLIGLRSVDGDGDEYKDYEDTNDTQMADADDDDENDSDSDASY